MGKISDKLKWKVNVVEFYPIIPAKGHPNIALAAVDKMAT